MMKYGHNSVLTEIIKHPFIIELPRREKVKITRLAKLFYAPLCTLFRVFDLLDRMETNFRVLFKLLIFLGWICSCRDISSFLIQFSMI